MAAIPGPAWLRGNFDIVWQAHRSLSPLGDTFVRVVPETDAELLDSEEKTARKGFRHKRDRKLETPAAGGSAD